MVFPCTNENIKAAREACTVLLREEVIIFSCCCNILSRFVTHTKKLEEVYFADEEFLHKKINKNGVYIRIMVCYRRYPEDMVFKAAHFENLTVWNSTR